MFSLQLFKLFLIACWFSCVLECKKKIEYSHLASNENMNELTFFRAQLDNQLEIASVHKNCMYFRCAKLYFVNVSSFSTRKLFE